MNPGKYFEIKVINAVIFIIITIRNIFPVFYHSGPECALFEL